MELKEYTVMICDACYNLEGQECHTPDCIFYLRSMYEAKAALDMMLIRPIVDGESIKAQEGDTVGTCNELNRLRARVESIAGKLRAACNESEIYRVIHELEEAAKPLEVTP